MKGTYYSCKKILRHNADINIIYGTRSNGKSFSVLQQAVEDFINGVGGLAYIRRRSTEIKKSLVDKYFRDPNFVKWLEKRTEGKYNNIFYKAGDLFICKKNGNEIDKESITLFGAAFSLQDAEKEKSLHYEFCYNLLLEEALTREKYLEKECVVLENLVSTIQRNGAARLWLVGNTVSRLCPYFEYWSLKNVRAQKVGTIADYRIAVPSTDENGEPCTLEKFIAVEYAENTVDHSASLALGKSRNSISGNEWESGEHPHLFFKLEDAEVLYTCFYEYMSFCFKMMILFYDDAPYLYIYPFTRQDLRLTKSRDIFTEKFETVENRWNRATLPQHNLMRDLIRKNKVVYPNDLSGDEFLQCLKSFNPFRA